MMNAIRLIAALLVLGLGGCANYPMGSLKTDLLPEDVAASYSLNTAWWKGYHDADLDRIVALALERNVDLALSAIKVNRALYQARLLSADLVPSFSANASAAASHNIDNGNAARSYQTEFGVSYEVDLWQKLRNAANAQEWEYKATMEDREAARLALVNNVADTYFELKYLDESIKVMDASVKRYQELLRLIEAKYEFGKVASVEPLQAQQSLLSARNSLLDLQDRQNVARQTLRDLLNIRPGENPVIGNADLMSYPTVGVDLDVPVAALSARPDILASEARLQSAFKTLESDRASWYPTISIGSTLGTSSSTSSKVFDLPLLAGTVRVSFPFLQWNTIRWNIKISEADFESAKLDFTQTVTSAERGGHSLFQLCQRAALAGKHPVKAPEGRAHRRVLPDPLRSRCRRAQGLSGRPEYGGQLHAFGAGSEIPGYPVREPDLQGDGRTLRTHLAAICWKGYTRAHVHQWRNTCSKSKKSTRRRLRTPNGSSRPAPPSCAMPWLRNAPWAFTSR